MEPITAYKFVVWGGTHFHSPAVAFEWLPGWNVISNGPLRQDAGSGAGSDYRNGFYSLKERPTDMGVYPCVVELEIAGTVIECERGYRSEFARIVRAVDWGVGYGDMFSYNHINRIYGQDNSTDRCRSVWPKKTPYTKVYEVPAKPAVSRYLFPIMQEPAAAIWHESGVPDSIPYSVLTIELDKAHRDSRGYYQYGYNAEHDMLVYRRVES